VAKSKFDSWVIIAKLEFELYKNNPFISEDGLKDNTRLLLSALNKKKKPEESSEEKNVQVKIFLSFKRYVYDPQKKMIQT
jgi:hypothetical protein